MMKASLHTIVLLLLLTGSLLGQSGFFRSYNHAPWFSDGERIVLFQDSLIVGQSIAVDSTGWYGFTLTAYAIGDGEVRDSFNYLLEGRSAYVRGLFSDGHCVVLPSVKLADDYPLHLFIWVPGSHKLDSVKVERVNFGTVPLFHATSHGIALSDERLYEQSGKPDQSFNGFISLYPYCSRTASTDTIFRDTIGNSHTYPNYSDDSKYVIWDIDSNKYLLLNYEGGEGEFVTDRSFEENEVNYLVHYDDLIVSDRFFYYERGGFDLYDETIAVFDDNLNLLWEAPFIPDRTELVPSYYWETRSIHVDDQYITVVGAEDRGETLPNSNESINHLYSTRYTLDGELVWFRRVGAIDSLLPFYSVSDVKVSDDGSVFAYGHYTHRNPPSCDTCPLTRNTFLLKLDRDGYLNGPPTSVEEVGASSSISIYPNPATDQITVSSQAIIHQVTLHHLDGRIAYQRAGLADQEYVVDVSNLSTGLYIVSVTDQLGRVSTSKVLVR